MTTYGPLRIYSNTAPATTVATALASGTGATTLYVASVSGYTSLGVSTSNPIILCLERGTTNQEVVLATAVNTGSNPSFTIQRAFDGTSANAHAYGTAVEHCSASVDYREPNTYINASGTVSPTASAPGDAGSAGTAFSAGGLPAAADHKHAREAWATSGTLSASSPSDAASAGTSNTVARGDHKHARESWAGTAMMWTGATTTITISGSSVVVAASAIGNTPIPNAIYLNGQAISRTVFSVLYNQMGTQWGVGDGSTTFNVPNTLGRVPAGLAGTLGLAIAQTTGSITTQIAKEQLPQHGHIVTDGGHVHTYDHISNNALQTYINLPTSSFGFAPIDGGERATLSPMDPANANIQITAVTQPAPTAATPIVQPTIGIPFIVWAL